MRRKWKAPMLDVRLLLMQVSQMLVWCVRVGFLGRQERNDEAGK